VVPFSFPRCPHRLGQNTATAKTIRVVPRFFIKKIEL